MCRVKIIKTTHKLGLITTTEFSGEETHFRRACGLKRLGTLAAAVNDALQCANQAEVVESKLTADKLFNYLLG